MPNKKIDDEEKVLKKEKTWVEKKVLAKNVQNVDETLTNKKDESTKIKETSKQNDFKDILKKELPKIKEKKALPKNKVNKELPKTKAKEKKLLPKIKEKNILSNELSEEQKDLKLLDRIKEFFKRNPDKTSSLDENIEQSDYLPEYYDLPYRYNETVVKILAQTPKRLFIYWDIADSDIEKYRKAFGEDFFEKTYPVLLVHNEELNYTYEIPINDFANSWYIDIKDSKNKYTVQLGRKFKEYPKFVKETQQIIQEENINLQNDYIEIVSSNTLEVPNDHVLFEKCKNKRRE